MDFSSNGEGFIQRAKLVYLSWAGGARSLG